MVVLNVEEIVSVKRVTYFKTNPNISVQRKSLKRGKILHAVTKTAKLE